MNSAQVVAEKEQKKNVEILDDYFPPISENLVMKKRQLYKELYKAEEGFNLLLKALHGDEGVNVHREFFRHCVKSFEQFKKDKDAIIIPLPDVDTLKLIIKFLYTGLIFNNLEYHRKPVDIQQILSFYETTFKCGFNEPTKELIIRYVLNQTGIQNFRECENYTNNNNDCYLRNYLYSSLYRSASYYIVNKKHQFLRLNWEDFTHILDHEYFNPGREASVLGLIVAWIRFDFDNRKEHFDELMKRISFPGLLQEDLKQLKNRCNRDKRFRNEMKRLFSKIMDYVHMSTPVIMEKRYSTGEKWNNYKSRKNKPWVYLTNSDENYPRINTLVSTTDLLELEEESLPWLHSRIPEKPQLKVPTSVFYCESTKILYLLENRSNGKLYFCDCKQDKSSRKWVEMAAKNPGIRKYSSVLIASEKIILLAGGKKFDEDEAISDVVGLDIEKPENGWIKFAELKTPRHSAQIQFIKNKIFIFGGQTINGDILSSVEMLDITQGLTKNIQWEQGTSMHKPRVNHASCVFGSNIYVVGGSRHNLKNTSIPTQCEFYDAEAETWKLLPQTRYGHENFCLVATEHATSSKNGPELWILDLNGEYFDNSLKKWIPKIRIHAKEYSSGVLIPENVLL